MKFAKSAGAVTLHRRTTVAVHAGVHAAQAHHGARPRFMAQPPLLQRRRSLSSHRQLIFSIA